VTLEELRRRLRLPVVVAPMFLVSGPELVIAAARAGLIGGFPSINARSAEEFETWLLRIERELEGAPYAVNLIVRSAGDARYEADLALIERFTPSLVITSVGQPHAVVESIHRYGGLVFHDVATMRHAEKAIEAGVDGLILLTAGAGGHTGLANPFAFVSQVRRRWQGAVLLAGGIADGASILAARALGADFAYMGTRFAATQESLAAPEYKALLVSQTMADVITTDRISGVSATFLRGSILRAGLDPDALPERLGVFKPAIPPHVKAWRDVWSGGHGVGLIDDVPSVAGLVDRLEAQFEAARASSNLWGGSSGSRAPQDERQRDDTLP
jgi:nitronate monooxygenase